jgi:hypothetical protein
MAVDATMSHVRIGMFVTFDPMPTERLASIHPVSHTILTTGPRRPRTSVVSLSLRSFVSRLRLQREAFAERCTNAVKLAQTA